MAVSVNLPKSIDDFGEYLAENQGNSALKQPSSFGIYEFYKLGDSGTKVYKQSIFHYKNKKSTKEPKFLYFKPMDKENLAGTWQVSSSTFDTFCFGSTIHINFKNQILRDLKYFFVLRLAMITDPFI